MKFNTALIITVLGVSLFLATKEKHTAAGVLGLFVILFSALTLAEHLFNFDLKIDQWLLADTFTDAKMEHPGRMSAFTALTFFMVALGLELALYKKYVAAQLVLTIALLTIYAAFVGILFNISGLFTFGHYSSIALPTSLGLLGATLGSLSCTAHQGWLREIFSEYSAAVTARYAIISFFLALPIFVGLLSLMLTKADVSPNFAIVVLMTGFAALILPIAFFVLRKLNRSDEDLSRLTAELRDSSRQLTYSNEELARKNKELDNLIHIISHDLKTPIMSLQGSIDILERKLATQIEEKERHLFSIPRKSVKRLSDTIKHLSEVIKTQKLADDFQEDIDLCALVRDIEAELQNTIRDSGAQITVHIDSCRIRYKRMHLHSIMQNLLTNALKFRHPNRTPLIEITAASKNDDIEIRVTDNGLGIPEKEMPGLFHKYKRFHEEVEGTGVGLYLVQQLLSMHGGTIKAMSQEGQGTTFILCLPAVSAS